MRFLRLSGYAVFYFTHEVFFSLLRFMHIVVCINTILCISCLRRKAEQELLYEREKLEAAFDQQLKKEVGRTHDYQTFEFLLSDFTFKTVMAD